MSDFLDRIRARVAEAKDHADESRPVLDKFRVRRENPRKVPPGESPVTVMFSKAKVRDYFYMVMEGKLADIVGDAPGDAFLFEGTNYTWACAMNTLVRLDQRFGDDLRSQYLAGRRAHDAGVPVKDNPWNEERQFWQWLRWYGGWWWGWREKHQKSPK